MTMTPREKLQRSYELAFHAPTLNKTWHDIQCGNISKEGEIAELFDTALLLHMSLPEDGYSSQSGLMRLAMYQAKARAFGMVAFLRNIRDKLGRPPLTDHVVPGNIVRDIGLPGFTH